MVFASYDLRVNPVVRHALAQDRATIRHERAAEQARRERRAAWLALHEEHGYRYVDLTALTGYGSTTIHTELRRARQERAAE